MFDVFSSDHAPYSYEGPNGKVAGMKAGGFKKVPNGVPGIEIRVPMLFSEGVLKGRIDLNQFVALTATNHAKLYGLHPKKGTIAVGTEGMHRIPLPDRSGRFLPGVRQEFDIELMKQIADMTKGRFFRAQDTDALRAIYAEIDRLEKSDVELKRWTRYRELFGWCLGPALALWCLELVLRRTWLRTLP